MLSGRLAKHQAVSVSRIELLRDSISLEKRHRNELFSAELISRDCAHGVLGAFDSKISRLSARMRAKCKQQLPIGAL